MSDHTEGIEVDFNYCEFGHLVGYDGYCDECANEASPDTNAEQSLKELVDGTRETIKIAMAAATTKSLQDILKASRDARGSQAKVYLNRELLDANFTHLLYANENGRNSTSEAPGLLADWLKRNPIKHGYGPNLS